MASTRYAKLFSRTRSYDADPWVLFTFTSWIPAFIFFHSNVAEIASVRGPSMYPYLNTDYDRSLQSDKCLSWKWNATENLRRGMIIAFWSPNNPEKQAVKRIVALEGDEVYTRSPYPYPIVQVPQGHVWVEGDDEKRSLDSNTYGPISKNLITGKITHIIWPWRRLGPVRWEQYRGKTRIKKVEDQGR